MKYILKINDSSKKISEMETIGEYTSILKVPKIPNTILTTKS